MAALKRLMQAGVALAISVGFSFCVYAQRAAAELPRDVTEFVNRRASCTEWSKKAIEVGAVDSNGWYLCFDIIDNERALRQKYAGNPEVLAALGPGNYTKVITRLPVRGAVPPASDR